MLLEFTSSSRGGKVAPGEVGISSAPKTGGRDAQVRQFLPVLLASSSALPARE
jgi:hypothetical protein